MPYFNILSWHIKACHVPYVVHGGTDGTRTRDLLRDRQAF